MSDSTLNRVLAEAALAKRFETDISVRASLSDVDTLLKTVKENSSNNTPGVDPSVALDDDGVPYITIGE